MAIVFHHRRNNLFGQAKLLVAANVRVSVVTEVLMLIDILLQDMDLAFVLSVSLQGWLLCHCEGLQVELEKRRGLLGHPVLPQTTAGGSLAGRVKKQPGEPGRGFSPGREGAPHPPPAGAPG